MDYNSLDSLVNALEGQEALVSTLSHVAVSTQLLLNVTIPTQLRLIEAAAKAHVKRSIPSEFGSDTLNEKAGGLPILKPKIQVQDALKKKAASSGMAYTLICTGPFLDWGIMVGFIMNLKEKSINLYDGGDNVFSATSLSTIAKAVTGVLIHLDETANRAVYVQDTATTLKKLAAMGKKAVGADGWKETVVPVSEVLEEAWAELKKDAPDPTVSAYNFVRAIIWGEGYGSHFQKLDNELLGLKQMSDAEVQNMVSSLAK